MTVAAKHTAGTENPYPLPHLDALESEAVHILREVVGEFERPVILFSGGKDSIVMLHLASKAFARAGAVLAAACGHRTQLSRGP
jgi:sulfate adenylyltransferase subunit 2